ncbi:MAG TPA: alpha/beta fold hydrolase [Candidatus Saccharimonadia bacterium]|nr:alpha/beta fold hydrolase [Candidatus Saccharimonadia bacterium]
MLPSTTAVMTPDGHAFDLAMHGPADAATGLLWLPAMGVPARKYARFADALAQRGIACALHEWRGGGTSTVRASRDIDWSYVQLLRDVDASRDAAARAAPGILWRIGGHSLGAQLAALALATARDRYDGLVVVGAGLPWWRSFPPWQQPLLLGVFATFKLLVAACGYFPGDRIGFAGREARGVIRDWTRSGLTGSYRLDGDGRNFDAALAVLDAPVEAVHFAQDRYVPAGSLEALVAKLPRASTRRIELIPSHFAGGRADHFAWMRDPAPVVDALLRLATPAG